MPYSNEIQKHEVNADAFLDLYPNTIPERIEHALASFNNTITMELSMEENDREYTKISSREVGQRLNDLKRQWKLSKKNGEELEARKILETIDMYTVLLFVRKRLGNENLIENTFGVGYRLELQRESYRFLSE